MEDQKDTTNGKNSAVVSFTPESPIGSTIDSGGWPVVEGLKWVGFVGFSGNKHTDLNFVEAVRSWNAQREERKANLVAILDIPVA